MGKLHPLLRRFEKLSKDIINFQTNVILTIFYFVIFLPYALVMKQLDPLKINHEFRSTWIVKTRQSESINDLLEQ